MGVIQRADLAEKIRRAFGIREVGVGSTISPEIVPVAIVDDLTGPTIDEGYPRLVYGSVAAGASAGVYSESFVINPIGTRTDFIFLEIWLRMTSAGLLHFRTGFVGSLNNMLGTQTLVFNQDLRTQAKPGIYVDSRNQAAGVTATRNLQITPASTAYMIFPAQVTLGPGTWLSIHPAAYAVGSELIFFGYERLRTTT